MPKRQKLNLIFLVLIVFSIIFFLLSRFSVFNFITSPIQNVFAPMQSALRKISTQNPTALKEENLNLAKKLVAQEKLLEDNKALRDQFKTTIPKSQDLIPAKIVSSPSFIPGVSVPESFVLDKGTSDGVKMGQAVIYKDNLVGIISNTNNNYSKVILTSVSSFNLTAQTLLNNSRGTVKGQGTGQITFENVLLSQKISKGDFVVTKGSLNEQGFGIAPGLIIGKIVSVNKNPSSLFQSAKIEPLIDAANLTTLFIIK